MFVTNHAGEVGVFFSKYLAFPCLKIITSHKLLPYAYVDTFFDSLAQQKIQLDDDVEAMHALVWSMSSKTGWIQCPSG